MKQKVLVIAFILMAVFAGLWFFQNYNKRISANEETSRESYVITTENMSAADKTEKYKEYLGKITAEQFAAEEDVDAATALVNYDEVSDQYSIELSLQTDSEINTERIGLYKNILKGRGFSEFILVINGEVK